MLGHVAAYRGAAIELCAGQLLPANRYEEWIEVHQRRLREAHLSLLLVLARLHEERCDYEFTTEALRRVVKKEHLTEEARAKLMRQHYALLGYKGVVLAHCRRLEEALREVRAQRATSSRALRG